MKKNISINIGGIIFHIEEDGYDKLQGYLESINKYFASFEDNREIIEDIEGRIAELFLNKLEGGKQVITHEDVEELIQVMGTTSDFEATIEAEEPPKENTSTSEPSETSEEEPKGQRRLYRDEKRKVIGGVAAGLAHYFNIDRIWVRLILVVLFFNVFVWGLSGFTFVAYIVLWIAIPGSKSLDDNSKVKKLFRNSDEKVLGGVASGLASYFGIDPVVTRIIFVISIFIGGAGLIIYIILWIIAPEAKTLTEKMQMEGEPVTLSNIEENLKKSLNVKDNEEENLLTKILLFPFRAIAAIFAALGKGLGPLLRILVEGLRILTGVILIILGFSMMLSFIICLAVLFGVASTWEQWVSFGGMTPDQVFNAFGITAIIAAFIVVFIPSLSLTLLGLVVILKRRVLNATVAWSLFGIWLLGFIGLAIFVPTIVNKYTYENTFREELTYVVNEATPTLKLGEESLYNFENVELQLRGHADSLNYKLKVETNARGSSRDDAMNNASATQYIVSQKEGDFIFSPHLTFGEAPFRFQDATITFYIPYGKVFRMDQELEEILRNTLWKNGYDADQMGGNDWVFSSRGIRCITCAGYREQEEDIEYGSDDELSYKFENYSEIKLSAMFDFEVEQSDEYYVELRGDEDLLDRIFLSQEGDMLEIKPEDNWKWWNMDPNNKIKLLIRLPELEYMVVNGASDGTIAGFKTGEMTLEINGDSEVNADIYPEILEVRLNGASELTLDGNADEMNARLNGASELNAFSFRVNEVDLYANGASSAKVYAKDELKAEAKSASSIRYRGNPQLNEQTGGMSSIRRD